MYALEELDDCAKELENAAEGLSHFKTMLDKLDTAAKQMVRSFSGSWMGYHARVYYKGLQPAPPGSKFDEYYGLAGPLSEGDWQEFEFDDVISHIYLQAGQPDLSAAEKAANQARDIFSVHKGEIISILVNQDTDSDEVLSGIKKAVKKLTPLSKHDLQKSWVSKSRYGQNGRDDLAMAQGLTVPPHIVVLSDVATIRNSFEFCQQAADLAMHAASHLKRKAHRNSNVQNQPNKVFVGHGRSPLWRELKDFLHDRLGLQWEEFNRVSVAGIANTARLSEMLDSAAFAFLIMTAEDETTDGKMQARLNVIHEAGLFQGRLGFSKAIVMVEDGCEEFSNIQGLGQIRFPKRKIVAAFEEVRQVLEREGIINK